MQHFCIGTVWKRNAATTCIDVCRSMHKVGHFKEHSKKDSVSVLFVISHHRISILSTFQQPVRFVRIVFVHSIRLLLLLLLSLRYFCYPFFTQSLFVHNVCCYSSFHHVFFCSTYVMIASVVVAVGFSFGLFCCFRFVFLFVRCFFWLRNILFNFIRKKNAHAQLAVCSPHLWCHSTNLFRFSNAFSISKRERKSLDTWIYKHTHCVYVYIYIFYAMILPIVWNAFGFGTYSHPIHSPVQHGFRLHTVACLLKCQNLHTLALSLSLSCLLSLCHTDTHTVDVSLSASRSIQQSAHTYVP